MRIITGKYRGRKIQSPKHEGVRPTIDRVKESLFNIISQDICGATVLDLFGGTGALGLECVSRGAEKVYIVDSDKDSFNLIKANAKNMTEDISITLMDYNIALLNFSKKGIKFDLIFLDPPYASKFAEFALDKIQEYDLLKDDGKIVWESLLKLEKPQKYDCKYEQIDNRTYGEIELTIYKK